MYLSERRGALLLFINSTVLQNGLRVVIAEQPNISVVSAGIFVRQGSRNETHQESGISHFIEHLSYNNKRAIQRGKKSVADLLNNGGLLNAFTTKECTSYEGTVLCEHSDLLYQALYDLVIECEFSVEDVNSEREIILAEYNRKIHSSEQVMDYLGQAIYGESTYGNWILGTKEFITNVTQEQLYQKYNEVYIADNMALVIVTNQNVHDTMHKINEIFSKVPSGVPTPIEVPVSEQVNLKLLKQKSKQIIIGLGGVAPSLRDEGEKNFDIGITAMGSIPNSRLFDVAREKHGLVYQINSYYMGYIQTGYWGIFSSVSKENFEALMKVLTSEVKRLKEEPLTQEEINRAVSVQKTGLFTNLQHTDYYLRRLGRREIFRESIYPNEMIRKYDLVTSQSIQKYVDDYINPINMSLVVMGDIEGDKVLEVINGMEE